MVAIISTLVSLPVALVLPANGEIPELTLPVYVSNIFAFLMTVLIAPGILAMGLNGAKKKKIELDLIIKKAHLAWKMLGFSILYAIAVTAGFVALIIPGFYLLVRFGFTPLILIEKEKIGVFDAMKEAGDRVKGKYLQILAVIFVIYLVTLILMIISSTISIVVIPGESILSTLAQQVFYALSSSVTLPLIYVGGAVVYLGLTAKTKKA